MNLPPSSAPPVPAGYGVAIPHSPNDLLAFIKSQQKQKKKSSASSSAISINGSGLGALDRQKKLEEEHEGYERKLMELEDFYFTQEGSARIRRAEDRLLMETEDAQSILLKDIYKEYDKQRFRDQVRRDVEARKARELAEKEERRRQAEVRRAAVVERIRKQQELEERRKREAEEAAKRIEEEKLRREQEERDRHLADQAQMVLEDQLSALAEQDFKDQQERKQWMQREKEKLLEWEKEQQRRDLVEEEQRKARMSELEAKRKKLEQLRLMQQAKPSDNAQKLKEEGERLNKQMRIQNRAKFVSKKISAAPSVEAAPEPAAPNDAASTVPAGSLQRAPSMPRDLHQGLSAQDESRTQQPPRLDEAIFRPTEMKTQLQSSEVTLSPELIAFKKKVAESSSETELKAWHQDIMAEKRGLRLEQRQRASYNLGDSTEDANALATIESTLKELTLKGDWVQQRMEEMMSATRKPTDGPGSAEDQVTATHLSATAATASTATLAAPATTTAALPATAMTIEDPSTIVFKRVETVLRESHRLLKLLDNCRYQVTEQREEENPLRSLTMLSMDVTRLTKEIHPNNDPLGYSDKLQSIHQELLQAMKKLEAMAAKSSPRNRSDSKIAHRPLSAKTTPSALSIGKEEMLLSSTSSPILSTAVTPKPKEDFAATIPVVETSPEDEDEDAGNDGGDGVEEEEVEDPSKLPGWEECLYTSMFSAAHHAAYFGFIDVLKFLCKYFDCFIMDKKGRTPLFYAALANRLDCVAELVGLDPQWIDVGDQKGDTPLHAAAISNGVQVLAFLLSCEVHPDTANFQGLTPSHLARSPEALQILQQSGAQMYCVDNNSRMPLWFACFEGRGDCVDFLCRVTPKEFILWPDHEGETCLHKAAAQGHHLAVEVLCRHLSSMEDLYVLNKKQHTACHVAANAKVLQVLYEQGANLWIKDAKERMPLFFASFFGRVDCVEMLLNLALSMQPRPSSSNHMATASRPSSRPGSAQGSSPAQSASEIPGLYVPDLIRSRDSQGDMAIHAASLCGHLPCVSLLSYFLRDEENKGKLKASDLAKKAGHHYIANYVQSIEKYRKQGLSNKEIFGDGVDFATHASFITYYGSRWMKAYDPQFQSSYYLDRVTNQSQWEKPDLFDMSPQEEEKFDKAQALLFRFYSQWNPEKLREINDILVAYRHRYTELFITLANKYQVQDLSMFAGVNFD